MTTLHGKPIKVGDTVWDSAFGWNIVTGVDGGPIYQIRTEYDTYTDNGYTDFLCITPQLFWQEFKVPSHAFEKPKLKVKKYQVLFENNGDYFTTANWRNHHFTSKKEFDEDTNPDGYKFISLILESEREFEE